MFAKTSFEATNSVSIITDENNRFSFTPPGHWSSTGDAESNYILSNLLEPKFQNDVELHVEEPRKRGNLIKIGDFDKR